MKILAAISLVLTLLGCGPEAEALPITFSFGGSVTSTNFDPNDPFSGTIGFGTPISGSYTFESTAVDSAPGLQTGSYWSFSPTATIVANIGGKVFGIDGMLNIGIANDFAGPVDQYTVFASFLGAVTIELFLQNFGGTAFSGDALPLVAPNLANFAVRNFLLTHSNYLGIQIEIMGTIDTLSCSAGCSDLPPQGVPEPATLASLCIGFLGLLGLRRRAHGSGRQCVQRRGVLSEPC